MFLIAIRDRRENDAKANLGQIANSIIDMNHSDAGYNCFTKCIDALDFDSYNNIRSCIEKPDVNQNLRDRFKQLEENNPTVKSFTGALNSRYVNEAEYSSIC